MAELRWIMTSSLVMLQVLSRTVTSVQTSSFTVRDGDDVTFPCESVIPDQKECDSTTWLFSSGSTATVTLFELGRIKEDKVRSDRLSVTEECSLVIKKVKGQDNGTYTCRQFQSGKDVEKDVVHLLSVGTSDDATKTTTKPTGAFVTKTTTRSPDNSGSDSHEGPSATKTTKPPETETPETKTTTSPPGDKEPVDPVLVSVSVGAAALVAITLGLVAWRRTKGNQTKTDDDAADPEGGVAYASVSFTKNTAGRAQAGLHPDDDEGDAVTYTTLKPPRSSAAADPGDLYATVN